MHDFSIQRNIRRYFGLALVPAYSFLIDWFNYWKWTVNPFAGKTYLVSKFHEKIEVKHEFCW